MISISQLKAFGAAYEAMPQRTIALERRIRIGSGFHGKWYRSQREHMLGWFVVQECQERRAGRSPAAVDAKGIWNRLKCSPAMFWLAECAGIPKDLLDQAEQQAERAAQINPMDGPPHGTMIRQILPWTVMQSVILSGPSPACELTAEEMAMLAFDRLTEKRATYRHLREWLP